MATQSWRFFNNIVILIFTVVPLSQAIPADRNITSFLDVTKYTLQYTLDFKENTFLGTVDIDFNVKSGEKIGTSLSLDSEGLSIVDVSLKDSTKTQALPFKVNDYNITLNLPVPLKTKNSYTVSIYFNGKISESNTGIFHHSAHNSKYISTYLYPFYARKVFPCFNNPLMKSVFSLAITTTEAPANVRAFSNAPIGYKNKNTFQFKDTPEMPLHNLFFTMGYYEVSKMAKNVFVPKNSLNENNEFYYVLNNKEFQQLLLLSKTPTPNIIIVPGLPKVSFTGYGVIALREDNFYLDLVKVTTEQRKMTLLDVFNAVYKLFYGSLLTPKTWSDIWLAESIPIYLKYNGLSGISEYGDPNDYIAYDIQHKVLRSNAYPHSRPIVDTKLKTEGDVLRFIEGPAMLKGAGVLSMLESVLTKEILIDVLMDYLSHGITLGGTVTTEDFVTYLSTHKEVVNKLHHKLDIKDVINTWLYQGGYPYIQTKRAGAGITIDEKVFIGGQLKNTIKLWKFPVFYSSANNPIFDNDQHYFWLLIDDNRTVALNFTLSPIEWLIINVNGTGLYRVNYEDSDWINLAYAISEDYTAFPSSTRAKLISDAFAMLYAGHANFTIIFNFLAYLKNEESFIPWLTALEGFNYLASLLQRTNLKEDFDTYMVTILNDIYYKLGIDSYDTESLKGTFRQKIVSTMCKHGHQDCLAKTEEDYEKMIKSPDSYTPSNDIKPVLICSGIRNQNDERDWMKTFNTTFNKMLDVGSDVKQTYFEALACPHSSDNDHNRGVQKFLDVIFETQTFSKDDILSAFKAIYTNPEHKSEAIEYFVVNEQVFREDLSVQDKIHLLQHIMPYLCTNDELSILQKYLIVVKPEKEMQDAVNQAMIVLNTTQGFLKTRYLEIQQAIHVINPPTQPTISPTESTTHTSGSTGSGPTQSSTTSTSTQTPKPSAATELCIFNLLTILICTFSLYLIT